MKSINVNLLFYLATLAWIDNIAGDFVNLQGMVPKFGPVVNTTEGEIRGMKGCIEGTMVAWFLGVPYAQPPTNQLRFRPPQKMKPWDKRKDTISVPNSCPQTITKIPGFEAFTVNTTISEDCLYLNVFLPSNMKKAKKANLPVMVWLHGGGFTGGSSTLEAYDGRYLALQSQAIIVTVNYRLGFLGFMKLGPLGGNLGLLDQKAALEWVQANIANFGGDPKKVTLFGQSAGASSVSLHLVSPLSSGLFQKAIMQSGSFLSPWSFVDLETAQKRSMGVVYKLGCNNTDNSIMMQCMLTKSADEIVGVQVLDPASPWWFVPTIDGKFITDEPKKMLDKITDKKPLLFGSTANEGSLFTSFTLQQYLFAETPHLTDAEQVNELNKLFFYYPYYDKQTLLTRLSEIQKKYPPHENNLFYNFNSITHALSDSWFVCPTNDFASLYKAEKTYNYLFTQTLPKEKLNPIFGATHGLELVFSFSPVIKYGAIQGFTQKDIDLSKKIISFWSNFAKNDDPNSEPPTNKYPAWPKYQPDKPKYLTLNEEFLDGGNAVVEESFRGEFCSFWGDLITPQQ